jgi:FeS assembly SUF system protein
MAESNEFSMNEFTKPAEAAPTDEAWGDEIDAAAEMPNEDLVARAGLPVQPGLPVIDSDAPIIEALRQVHDPEIPVNIYDLGLVYDILRSDEGDVKVRMTLTAPGCPVAGELPTEVAEEVARVRGVGVVEVYLVWDPPWSPDRMSEGARMLLDYF